MSKNTIMIVVIAIIATALLGVAIYFLVKYLANKDKPEHKDGYYSISPNFLWNLKLDGITQEQITAGFTDAWKTDGKMFSMTLEKIVKTGNEETDTCILQDKKMVVKIGEIKKEITLKTAGEDVVVYENAAKDHFVKLNFKLSADTLDGKVIVTSKLSGGLGTFTLEEIKAIPLGFRLEWYTKQKIATKLNASSAKIQQVGQNDIIEIIKSKEYFQNGDKPQIDIVQTYTIDLEAGTATL